MLRNWLVLFFTLWAVTASAHSVLQTSSPAADDVLAVAPENLDMTFRNKIRLTRVTLTHNDEAETDLSLETGGGFTTNYTIPLSSTAAGTYLIDWRGLSDDGHPMNGTFTFTVEGQ